MIDVNQNVQTGPFTKTMAEIGLTNAVDKLNDGPLPATHHRGSKTIFAMYISACREATRARILPKLKITEAFRPRAKTSRTARSHCLHSLTGGTRATN